MESLKDSFMAPFSSEAAARTTPFRTAALYTGIGFLASMLLRSSSNV